MTVATRKRSDSHVCHSRYSVVVLTALLIIISSSQPRMTVSFRQGDRFVNIQFSLPQGREEGTLRRRRNPLLTLAHCDCNADTMRPSLPFGCDFPALPLLMSHSPRCHYAINLISLLVSWSDDTNSFGGAHSVVQWRWSCNQNQTHTLDVHKNIFLFGNIRSSKTCHSEC